MLLGFLCHSFVLVPAQAIAKLTQEIDVYDPDAFVKHVFTVRHKQRCQAPKRNKKGMI